MPHPDMNEFWTNGHPEEGLLHEWLDEQLSAADASTVAAHVAECAECSAAVAEARGLIAASHRILSALDDVPAGVIPQSAHQQTAQTSESSIDFNKRVEELRNTRVAVASTSASRARSSMRWRQAGKIAALLLIAIIPGVYFLRGDDVTAPMAASGASPLATTERAVTQPNAAAPQSKSDMAGADSAAPTPLAKSAPAAESRAVGTVAANEPMAAAVATAPAIVPASPSRQLRDDAAARNADDRRAAFASRAASDSSSVVASSATSKEAAKKSAAKSTAKAEALATPVSSDALSGRVAGVSVAPQDRARSSRAAGAEVQSSTASENRAAPAPPVPQLANAPAPIAPGAARTQPPDTLGSTQAISAAVRRSSDAEAAREPMPIGARALARADMSPTTAVLPFDSVVVTRTNCSTSCETSVLHVTLNGAVRYNVSSGSAQSAPVYSQLSSGERNELRQVILATLPNSFTAPESMRCTLSRSTGAPSLTLLIARTPLRIVTRGDGSLYRCATDNALTALGATIDSIAHTAELRRRIR